MHCVTRSSNQSSGSISDELRGYFESESFLETLRKVVTDVVAEESFQLALKRSIDAAVGSAVEPLKEKLGGLDQYVLRVNKLEATICDLESQLSVVRKESNYAMNKANDNEQYSRKYNLRFIGIEEQKDENCTDKIVEFCKNMLRIDMPVSTIDRAHRVGRKTEGKSRPIIVKFMNYGSKLTVCMQRKLLRDTNFYINEDLTYINMKLFSHARKSAKNIKSSWFSDGKLLVRSELDDKIYRIRNMEDFERYNFY